MIGLKDAIHELNHNVEFKNARMVTEGEVVIYLRELERLLDIEEQGRLIDIEEIPFLWNKYVKDNPDTLENNAKEFVQSFKDAIKKAGLIEQKHGYWTGPDGYDCSECGEDYMEVADADAYASGWQPNYCPHCGAKMDEE